MSEFKPAPVKAPVELGALDRLDIRVGTIMKVEEVYDPTYGAATGGPTMLRQFIETGTHLGDTLAYIARDKRVNCISIELSGFFFCS